MFDLVVVKPQGFEVHDGITCSSNQYQHSTGGMAITCQTLNGHQNHSNICNG